MNLMLAEASSSEELTRYKKKQVEILKKRHGKNSQFEELKQIDPELNDPEAIIKKMIETMTPLDGEQMIKPSEVERKTEIDDQGYVQLDYEESLDFYDSKYAKFMRYYQYLERIISLEWFIYKLQFKQTDVIPLDNAIQNGLPFWQTNDYEERLKAEMPATQLNDSFNKISQEFLYSKIITMKTKRDIADELSSMSMGLKNLIQRFQDTPEER